jgi:hypothetical protein
LQAVIDALSNRISATGGGGGSVTSTELSAAAAGLSARVDSVNSFLSGISARSAGGVSTHGLQSVINALSNRISAAGGGGGSVTSNELSAVSAAVTSVNARVNSITSVFLSATGQVVPQIRSRGNVTSVVSGTAIADIASISISCDANAAYCFDGAIMWEKATSGGVAFTISLPALRADGSYFHANLQSGSGTQNAGTGAGIPDGYAAMSALAAGTTIMVSVSAPTVNVLRFMRFEGYIVTSAAGTMQLGARGSVAGDSLTVRGGFIRAYRIF